eukprot:g5923.t1
MRKLFCLLLAESPSAAQPAASELGCPGAAHMADDEETKHKIFYQEGKLDAIGQQLISFDDGKLEVVPAGAQLLNAISSEQPVNLVFIFGNARSGKSFMMNCITGVRSLFRVQNSSTPCTKGVDMSSHFAKWQDLAATVGVPIPEKPTQQVTQVVKEEAKTPFGALGKGIMGMGKTFKKLVQLKKADFPRLGFVDVEGQGAEDGT